LLDRKALLLHSTSSWPHGRIVPQNSLGGPKNPEPLNGRDLLALGFTVSQVVHDYGDIWQAITELAVEQNAPITTDEFHVLNRCLDTVIADAVTEHARIISARAR
jgi:hypothetical protein